MSERLGSLTHSLAQRVARAGVPASGALRSQQGVSLLASLWSCRPAELRPSTSRVESSKPTQTVLRSVVALRAAPICARLEYDGALCVAPCSAWRTSRRCKTARERFPKPSRRLDSRLDSIHSCSIERERERETISSAPSGLQLPIPDLIPLTPELPLSLSLSPTLLPSPGNGHRSRRTRTRTRTRTQRRRRLWTGDCFDSRRQAGRRVATSRRGIHACTLSFMGHSN